MTDPAGADDDAGKLRRRFVEHGHKGLLHAERRAAAAHIARHLGDVLHGDHLDGFLADAAGVKLGGILEIRDSADTGFDGSGIYAKNAVAEEAAAGTSVLASKQTVSATVSITFALEDGE